MSDDPANVRCRPINLTGIDAVDIFHGPFERDQVAAVVAHDPLGNTGGARSIENVERIGRRHRYTVNSLGSGHAFFPVEVAAGDHGRLGLRTLEDNGALWFGCG